MNDFRPCQMWATIGCLVILLGGEAEAKTRLEIVVGNQASSMETYAARELQRYLYLVSGELPQVRRGAEAMTRPGFVLGTLSSSSLIARLAAEGRLSLSPADPGAQGYVLKKIQIEGRDTILIAGGDDTGVLYGVYGLLQDYYGVGFYLGGDVLPDSQTELRWPDVDERKKPAVGIRGFLPWTNFPQSATSYSWEDWKFVLDQMAKMRMNFLHIHNYNGEAGHNEMFHNVSHKGITPRVWMATARSGHAWGGRPGWDPNQYLFGAADLFADYDFGADCARHNETLSPTQAFRKGVAEFQRVIAYAHTRGIRIGLGLDIDLLPPELKEFKADDPQIVSNRVSQLITDYPNLDYLLCFQSEGIPGDQARRRVWRAIFGQIYGSIKARAPQIRLAVAGWGIKAEDVADLPPDVICAPISSYSDKCESGAIYGQRECWGCPWLERDFNSSVYYYPYNMHLSNSIAAWQARAPNLTGFYCLTWRLTDAIDPKMFYIANAPWDTAGKYTSSEAVYRAYAELNYGPVAAQAVTGIINQNEPFACDWSECVATPAFSESGTAQGYLLNVEWFSIHAKGQSGVQVRAAKSDAREGTQNAPCTEGGECVGYINPGNWLQFNDFDFGPTADVFEARVAAAGVGGLIEIRLDSPTGAMLGVCPVETTGEWQNWVTRQIAIPPTGGKHTVWLKFRRWISAEKELAKAQQQLHVIDQSMASTKSPAQRARLARLRCRIAAARDHLELNQKFEHYTWADLPGAVESWAGNFVNRVTDISSLGNVMSSQNRFVQLNYLAKEKTLRQGFEVQPPNAVQARGTREGSSISWMSDSAQGRGFNVYRDGRRVNERVLPPDQFCLLDRGQGAFRYTVTALAADGRESPPSVPAHCEAGSADRTAPRIFVISPPTAVPAGQAAWITARILDNRNYEAISARLYYRSFGDRSWKTLLMTRRTKAVFTASLPVQGTAIKGLEYYVQSSDGDNCSVFPAGAPAMPLSLVVDPAVYRPVPNAPELLAQDGQTLAWNQPAGDVLWFQIYRSRDSRFIPGPDSFLTYVASDTTRFQDNGLDWSGQRLSGTWHYRVTAVSRAGVEGPASHPAALDAFR